MNKKVLFTTLLLALLVAAAAVYLFSEEEAGEAGSAGNGARAGRPNIIVIFPDGLQSNAVRALGNPQTLTPNLDEVVRRGVAFPNAYIMGSTSAAVCIPSRAMLLTGRELFELQGDGHVIPPSQTTLPEAFLAAGYDTFISGHWHQDRASLARSFSGGGVVKGFFPGWYEKSDGHWHTPVHDFDPEGGYPEEAGYFANGPVPPFQPPFTRHKEGVHSSELFTDPVVDYLTDYDGEKPFFIFVSYVAVHDPFQSPRQVRDLYKEDDIAVPANFMPRHPFDNGDLYLRDEVLLPHPRTPEAVRTYLADYYAILTHLDAQVGRLLDVLKKRGLDKNTFLVVSADHGNALGQHGLLGKQNLYDHSAKAPLVLSGPGIPEGEQRDNLVYLLDVFPTLTELAGIPTPESVRGKSLAPAIKDAQVKIREGLHLAYRGVQRAYRNERYKLVEYMVQGEQYTQLFDLQSDPLEMNNLATGVDYQETVTALRRQLSRWRTAHGDNQPVKSVIVPPGTDEPQDDYFWEFYNPAL